MKTSGRTTVSVVHNRMVRPPAGWHTMSFVQWRKLEASLPDVPKGQSEFLPAEKGFEHIDKGIKDFLRRR
jgi:hypothetical protein